VRLFEEKLTELNQNEFIKRSKEILERTKVDLVKQNEALLKEVRERSEGVKQVIGKVGSSVGSAASTVAKPIQNIGEKLSPYVPDISESKVVKQVGKTVSEAEQKILDNTDAYQYGGFKSKEQRQRKPMQMTEPEVVEHKENPEAGSNVVSHKDSAWSQKWNDWKDNSPLLQRWFGLKRTLDESNNVFVYFARELSGSLTGRIASIFSETETAQAMREITTRDPAFRLDVFMRLLREQILPEILEALLAGDLLTLRRWCSSGMMNVLKASFEAQLRPGCQLGGRILDMRALEMITARVLENDTPVLVFSFNTQQISWMKENDKIVVGAEDAIENVTYVMAMAKGEHDPMTNGWKLVELAVRDKSGSW